MQASIQGTRLLLKIAWLIPVAWLIGNSFNGSIGIILPAYIFIVFGLALIPFIPTVEDVWERFEESWQGPFLAVSVGLAALAVFLVVSFLGGTRITIPTVAINWILLIAVAFLVTRILDQDVDYEGVIGDFRLGIVGTVFVLAIAYKGDGHAQFTAQVFAGVIAYGLLGVFGLALARRYAIEDPSNDERTQGIQADWLLSVLLLLGVLAVIGVLLAQLFEFDIISALGNLTQPLRNVLINGFLFVAREVLQFLAWLISLLGFHALKPPHLHNPTPPKAGPPRIRNHHLRSNHLPAWLTEIFKALGIILLGAGILAVLTLSLRVIGRSHRSRVKGERRVSAWSWRKMGRWFFGHGRQKLAELLDDYKPQFKRRQPVRSVRDVYRAFLTYGGRNARPRTKDETGLEYSGDLSARWPESRESLHDLNELYLAERYGSRPTTEELLRRAKADLQAVELGAGHARSVPPAGDDSD